jgi:hypothetical protein
MVANFEEAVVGFKAETIDLAEVFHGTEGVVIDRPEKRVEGCDVVFWGGDEGGLIERLERVVGCAAVPVEEPPLLIVAFAENAVDVE